MYLNYLDEKQQRVFLEAAVLMVRSDETVAAVEQAMIDRIRAESQFDLKEPRGRLAIEKVVAKAVDTYRETAQRNVFTLELAGVCVIDGESHEAEIRVLDEFADALGVPEERVEEFLELARSAQRLIGPAE